MKRKFLRLGATAAGLLMLGVRPGFSQALQAPRFPSKPVKLLIPFAPGQGSDVLARALGERLARQWEQPVIVDNRPGANGALAIHELVRAPNAHTLLLTSNSPVVINPNVYKKLGYDVGHDLKPVALLATTSMVLLAAPTMEFSSPRELIAHLKAHPGKYSYGSPGVGSTSHLTMEALIKKAGLDLVHAPYKGSALALNDLISGNIQLMADALPSALPHVKSGRVKLVALVGAKPSSYLPGAPLLADAGISDLGADPWYGIFAPASASEDALAALHRDIKAALDDPAIQERARFLSLEQAAWLSRAEFRSFIDKDLQRWEAITKWLGVYRSE